MQKLPLGDAVDTQGNSPSPFAHLKEDTSLHNKLIWRTGSLDEGCLRMYSGECSDENQDHESSVVTALHTSFDASLLEDEEHDEAKFPAASAGKKHASTASTEDLDIVAPGTVRKLRRRSDIPPGAKKTPGRHSHTMWPQAKMGDNAPTSASRRRRSHQKKSPHRHQSVVRIPPTATPLTFKFQETIENSPATPRVSLFGSTTQLKPPQILTPTRAVPGPPQALAAKSTTKPQECNTGTTVNSSFDAMNETDSHERSSPTSTPFRFTSFPASLPRVNNPRTSDRIYEYPPSTRKHTTFSAFASGEDGQVGNENRKGPVQPLQLSRNNSQEDDGTQNSSLSSVSAADALREIAAPLFQPKTLVWPEDTDMKLDCKNSADSEGHESRLGAASSIQSKLFADEDDLITSPGGGQAFKTRLNFNNMTSPSKQIMFDNITTKDESHLDLSRPYEQRKTRSFPSPASSTARLRNISGFEGADSSTTPSRLGVISITDHENPLSPEQVKFHFHVDESQCSPIPGIPEEACDGDTAMDIDGPALEPRSSRLILERPPRSAPRKRSQRLSGGQVGARKHESDDQSRLSVSIESGDGGSSTSSKMRRLRPMPDMSAFDAGISARSASSSRNDRSTDESSGAMDGGVPPQSPQLVCPPTPERTPAWAQSEKGPHPYNRQNSLITTKVLATCPVQVLDGHSSLENSLMDDDCDVDGEDFLFGRRPANLSYSAVEEDVEGEEGEESPVRDLSDLQAMFSAPPSSAYKPRLTRHASAPLAKFAPPPLLISTTSCIPRVPGFDSFPAKGSIAKTPFQPKSSIAKTPASPKNISGSFGGVEQVISFSADFENLAKLGSGAFADVYKVRSKLDQQLYAVKRNRRHFRGKRDREMAMAEVRIMQRLQSVCAERGVSSSDKKEITKNSYSLYLLFFFRAWQEDGHFFCQTELCCRDTCREMKEALGSQWPASQKKYPSLLRHFPARDDGHFIPEKTVWKICHDVAAGLSHIHSLGVVHNDIKPSNIFLVAHNRLGAMLKIGDFGMAGDVGTSEDGQEGDTAYMAPELLSSGARHPSADIFSLGLTLYELASTCSWELPSEGSKWQELRNGSHSPDLPRSRCPELSQLIKAMINPDPKQRPTADDILERVEKVRQAGNRCDDFLRDYIKDIEEYDRIEEERLAMEQLEADERGTTPRNASGKAVVRKFSVRSPTLSIPFAPAFFTPEPAST